MQKCSGQMTRDITALFILARARLELPKGFLENIPIPSSSQAGSLTWTVERQHSGVDLEEMGDCNRCAAVVDGQDLSGCLGSKALVRSLEQLTFDLEVAVQPTACHAR